MSIIGRFRKKLTLSGSSPSPSPTPAAPQSAEPPEEAAPESPVGEQTAAEFIEEMVKSNPMVLFMKGTPMSPQCGFSATAAGVLNSFGKPYAYFNVFDDEEVRQGVKDYSNWPTLPQVYVSGEFLGGSDILAQMHKSGELAQAVKDAYAEVEFVPGESEDAEG